MRLLAILYLETRGPRLFADDALSKIIFSPDLRRQQKKNKTEIQEKDQPTSDPVKPAFAIVTISSR